MGNLAETLAHLYEQFGHLKGISIECQKELVAIGIVNQAARAEIFLQGAQVSAYKRRDRPPALFLSDACTFSDGQPLRGGIPICWPWFGQLEHNDALVQQQFVTDSIASAPAHGFVRHKQWTLTDIHLPSADLTVLNFVCDIGPKSSPLWPYAAELSYTVSVGKTLTAMLSVRNTDNRAFTYSAALHTYFAVDDIHRARVSGLQACDYVDHVNDRCVGRQEESKVEVSAEFDRIYRLPDEGNAIELKEGKRRIRLNTTGSRSAVVWNPWIDKSRRLSQFNPDDYQGMLCIETANADLDFITLAPGDSHSLGLVIADG